MTATRATGMLEGPGIMLLSAGIFGYFGWAVGFPVLNGQTGALLALPLTLQWTVRAAAVGFLVSGLVAMRASRAGNLLYGAVGLLAAVMLAVIVIWDLASPWFAGIHWFLLLVLAAWNAYASLASLRGALGGRPIADPAALSSPGTGRRE